jgi:hypothetical protein
MNCRSHRNLVGLGLAQRQVGPEVEPIQVDREQESPGVLDKVFSSEEVR